MIERAVDAVERVGQREVRARPRRRALRRSSRAVSSAAALMSVPTPGRQRQLGEQRQQQAARPGADVEDAQRPLRASPRAPRCRAPPRSASRCRGADRASPARAQSCGRRTRARRGCATPARARSAARRIGSTAAPARPAAGVARVGDDLRAVRPEQPRHEQARASSPGILDARARAARRCTARTAIAERRAEPRRAAQRIRHPLPWPPAGSPGAR